MENLEPVARPEHPSTNSPSQASPNKRTTRIRRTPEEARAVILDAAEKRLERLGLEGLNVVGVADEAAAGDGVAVLDQGRRFGGGAELLVARRAHANQPPFTWMVWPVM